MNLRPPVTLGVDGLSQELSNEFDSTLEIVRSVYMFISTHIRFSHKEPQKSNEKIIRDGVANAFGICFLFLELCERNGIRVEIIRGYTKTIENPEVLGGCNHCWNKVKIEGEWRLLDCCWGGDFYFLTNPKKFVLTHLPFHEGDQFVYPPLTKHDFRTLVFCYKSRLFDFGIMPDNSVSYRYFTKLKTNYVTIRFRYTKKRGKSGSTLPFTPIGNTPHNDGSPMTPSSFTPSTPSALSPHPFDSRNVSRMLASSSCRLKKMVSIDFISPENGKSFRLSGKYNSFFIVYDFSGGFLIHLFLPYRGLYKVDLFVSNTSAQSEILKFCCSYRFSVEKQFMYDISFFKQNPFNPVNNLMVLSPVQNVLQNDRSIKFKMFMRRHEKRPTFRGLRIRVMSVIRPTAKMILEADLKRKFLESLGEGFSERVEDSTKKKKGRKKGKKKKKKMEVSTPSRRNRNIIHVDLKNDWVKGRRNIITKRVLLRYYPEDDLDSLIEAIDEDASPIRTHNKLSVIRKTPSGSELSDMVMKKSPSKDISKKREEEFYPLRAVIEYQFVGAQNWEVAAEFYLTDDGYKMVDFDVVGKTYDGMDEMQESKIYEEFLDFEKTKYFDTYSRITTIGPVLRTGTAMGINLVHPDRPMINAGTGQVIPIVMKFLGGEMPEHLDFFLTYKRFFRFETSFNIFYVNRTTGNVSTRILFSQPGKYAVEIGYREENVDKYRFVAKFIVAVAEHAKSGAIRRRKHGKTKMLVPMLQRSFDENTSSHSLVIFKPLFDVELSYRQLYNFLYLTESGRVDEPNPIVALSGDGIKEKTIVFTKKEPEVEVGKGLTVILSHDLKDDERRYTSEEEKQEQQQQEQQQGGGSRSVGRYQEDKEKRRVLSGIHRFSFIPKPDDYSDVVLFEIMKKARVKVFEHRKKIVRTFEPRMKMKFQVGRYKKYGLKFKLSSFMEEMMMGKVYFLDVGSRGEYNLFFNLPRRGLYMLQVMVKEYVDSQSFYLREGATYWVRCI